MLVGSRFFCVKKEFGSWGLINYKETYIVGEFLGVGGLRILRRRELNGGG